MAARCRPSQPVKRLAGGCGWPTSMKYMAEKCERVESVRPVAWTGSSTPSW